MTRGIRIAFGALLAVAALIVVISTVALIEGKVTTAISVIPTVVVFLAFMRSYRENPTAFHEKMTGRDIARAVLPLVGIAVLAFVVLFGVALDIH
jgi:hypothetical protein